MAPNSRRTNRDHMSAKTGSSPKSPAGRTTKPRTRRASAPSPSLSPEPESSSAPLKRINASKARRSLKDRASCPEDNETMEDSSASSISGIMQSPAYFQNLRLDENNRLVDSPALPAHHHNDPQDSNAVRQHIAQRHVGLAPGVYEGRPVNPAGGPDMGFPHDAIRSNFPTGPAPHEHQDTKGMQSAPAAYQAAPNIPPEYRAVNYWQGPPAFGHPGMYGMQHPIPGPWMNFPFGYHDPRLPLWGGYNMPGFAAPGGGFPGNQWAHPPPPSTYEGPVSGLRDLPRNLPFHPLDLAVYEGQVAGRVDGFPGPPHHPANTSFHQQVPVAGRVDGFPGQQDHPPSLIHDEARVAGSVDKSPAQRDYSPKTPSYEGGQEAGMVEAPRSPSYPSLPYPQEREMESTVDGSLGDDTDLSDASFHENQETSGVVASPKTPPFSSILDLDEPPMASIVYEFLGDDTDIPDASLHQNQENSGVDGSPRAPFSPDLSPIPEEEENMVEEEPSCDQTDSVDTSFCDVEEASTVDESPSESDTENTRVTPNVLLPGPIRHFARKNGNVQLGTKRPREETPSDESSGSEFIEESEESEESAVEESGSEELPLRKNRKDTTRRMKGKGKKPTKLPKLSKQSNSAKYFKSFKPTRKNRHVEYAQDTEEQGDREDLSSSYFSNFSIPENKIQNNFPL
ncbi:hypothetical protein BO70DRAFT_379634 [Aspergillus heteromorphus CBS 117.55]|uniref:Uncharacterized protein n=1 Tax=Aspergillus heteromorphus CBS 117.55 TaxID=1448321 RepID=A0A317W9V9_9EURO|nr:uncharacterized protein BO70DRAFT_379634 [Aspergillus heteromorphus CBS 117.55]PWY82097.1 hypothetical protein BO70DRAFT_379634 [Aspergillus heteromorphus CBS 117.55]